MGRRNRNNRLFKIGKALPLDEAMHRFQTSSSIDENVWNVKSWKDGVAHDGVLAGSKGYALIRKVA